MYLLAFVEFLGVVSFLEFLFSPLCQSLNAACFVNKDTDALMQQIKVQYHDPYIRNYLSAAAAASRVGFSVVGALICLHVWLQRIRKGKIQYIFRLKSLTWGWAHFSAQQFQCPGWPEACADKTHNSISELFVLATSKRKKCTIQWLLQDADSLQQSGPESFVEQHKK